MIEDVPAYPQWTDYLICPNHKYEELPVSQVKGWVHFTLGAKEFEDRYGCSKAEDNFNRADKFWGPREDYERYERDVELHDELKQIPYNTWSGWGVGNLGAIAKLTSLERRGYYQK